MFVQKRIQMLVSTNHGPIYRHVDGYADETLGVATHPVPERTVLYRRCPAGWMYTTLKRGTSIQVSPMPADRETAVMFAEQMASRGWDEPIELATYWMEHGIGQWVMPSAYEEVRSC